MTELITGNSHDFATGIGGWGWDGTTGAGVWCATDGHTAPGCMQIGGGVAHTWGADDRGYYKYIPVTPGKIYKIGAWLKGYAPTYRQASSKIRIMVSTRAANPETLISTIATKTMTGITTFDWVYVPIMTYKAITGDYYLMLVFSMLPTTDPACYLRVDDVSCTEYDAETLTVDNVSLSGADYTAWTEPIHADTKPTTTAPANTIDTIALSGCRRERVSFQLAIRPTAAWSAAAVSFTDLTTTGEDILAGTNLSFKLGHFLYCTRKVANVSNIPYSRNGLSIEPLVSGTSFSLADNTTSVFIIEALIPPGTVAGTYSGTITVKDGVTTKFTLPITVTVYDFDLPEGIERKFLVNARLNPNVTMALETKDAAHMIKYNDEIYSVLHGQSDLMANALQTDLGFDYNPSTKVTTVLGSVHSAVMDNMAAKGYQIPLISMDYFTYAYNAQAQDNSYYSLDHLTWLTYKAETVSPWTYDRVWSVKPYVLNTNLTQYYQDAFGAQIRAIKKDCEDRGMQACFVSQWGEEIDPTDDTTGQTTVINNQFTYDIKTIMPDAKVYMVGKPGDSYSLWDRSADTDFIILIDSDIPFYDQAAKNRFGQYNLGFYVNTWWSNPDCLHHHLWKWIMLPLAGWMDGYRSGTHLWQTISWATHNPWDDGASHDDSEYVVPGSKMNFFYPPNATLGYTDTPTRSIRLQALGYGVGLALYAEKLQSLIDARYGTATQRAAALTDLMSIKTDLNMFLPVADNTPANHFAFHYYSVLDDWKEAVAGHIELLEASPPSGYLYWSLGYWSPGYWTQFGYFSGSYITRLNIDTEIDL